MVRWRILVRFALLSALCGCAGPGRSAHYELERSPHPYLLFNAATTALAGSNILHDSDWPSVIRGPASSEVIFYRERFVDHQTQTGNGHVRDRAYRRFDSVRVGREIR